MATMDGVDLTVDSAGKMTTFELRKEVEKRGLLEGMECVNHRTLLRRLVQAKHE